MNLWKLLNPNCGHRSDVPVKIIQQNWAVIWKREARVRRMIELLDLATRRRRSIWCETITIRRRLVSFRAFVRSLRSTRSYASRTVIGLIYTWYEPFYNFFMRPKIWIYYGDEFIWIFLYEWMRKEKAPWWISYCILCSGMLMLWSSTLVFHY